MSLGMFTVYCWITIYSILSVIIAFKIIKIGNTKRTQPIKFQ